MVKIISITGDLGSGKSTVSALLRSRLHYDYVYTGKIQREIAHKHGMTTLELNKYAETHPEIDREIDATFKSLNDSTDLIVDSRLAWHFIPKSFKVFLKTNLIVSARRIAGDRQRESEKYTSETEATRHIIARKTSENKRYTELYGANCSDLSQFNLVIDTSFVAPESVADSIYTEYHAWLVSGECTKALLSPQNIYPTQPVHTVKDAHLQHDRCAKDADSQRPVAVVNFHSFDYILDGHRRTSCALQNNVPLIPVIYEGENSALLEGRPVEEVVSNAIKSGLFYDWEVFNAFRFLIYPTVQ